MSTVTVVVAYVIKTVFSCVNVISLCGDRCVLVSSVDVGVCVLRSVEREDIHCRLCDKVLHSPNELLVHLTSLMHRQNQPVI